VHTHLTHSVKKEHCEAQYYANSLSVLSLTECNSGTIQTLYVGKWVKENVLIDMAGSQSFENS